MFGIGTFELILIFGIAIIFIGPQKLPQLARSLGKGIREFQKIKDEMVHPHDDPPDDPPPSPSKNVPPNE